MATSCIHDAIRDLLLRINADHVMYLSENDFSIKLKYRNSLQKYIHELLCVVPHHQKFNFSESAEVLCRSINRTKASNLSKLVNSWVALAAYANNLFSQPWRKEFHEITTYCGYYKHQVENYLIGAEKILKIMGYERKSDCELIFNVSTDPELICAVSLDCIIALTECQVIFAVYKEISRNLPTCTLGDILEYRQTHVCSVDEAIQGIYYLYLSRRSSSSTNNHHHRHHHHKNNISVDCCCNAGDQYCDNNKRRTDYSSSSSSKCVTTTAKGLKNGYRNCCSRSGSSSSTTGSCIANGGWNSCSATRYKKSASCGGVPTAKLINIDSSITSSIDSSCCDNNNNNNNQNQNHNRKQNCDRQRTTSSNRSWTELRNSSNDITTTTSNTTITTTNSTNTTTNNININNNNTNNNNNNNNKRQTDGNNNRSNNSTMTADMYRSSSAIFDEYSASTGSSSSTYNKRDASRKYSEDNNIRKETIIKKDKDLRYYNKELPIETATKTNEHVGGNTSNNSTSSKLAQIAESLQGLKLTDESKTKSNQDLVKNRGMIGDDVDSCNTVMKTRYYNYNNHNNNTDGGTTWECNTCTYHNSKKNRACEMCGKSRSIGSEVKPLISGGKQCPHCTLVNSKDAVICEACSNSLKDSPTYI